MSNKDQPVNADHDDSDDFEKSKKHDLDNVPAVPPVPVPRNEKDKADNLKSFQVMLGMTSFPDKTDEKNRSTKNDGVYAEIIWAEKWRMRQYYFCTVLLNGCILAQIVFAATITALGASASPHDIITVFGAINTATAGLLALMKGQGLPDRIRRDWHGLRDVRLHIDARERSIAEGWCDVGVKEEVDFVLSKYKNVQDMMENNRPDTYVIQGIKGTTWDPETGLGGPGATQSTSTAASKLKSGGTGGLGG